MHLKHDVIIHKSNLRGADNWCKERYGDRWNAIDYRDGRWACFWAGLETPEYYVFHFRYEEDALIFSLIWTDN